MRKLTVFLLVFIGCYYMPLDLIPFRNPGFEALALVKWYAREHVVTCLIPAFLIAGAISVFVSKAGVIRYFGAGAGKVLSYGVASVSGAILAVCSCTVLPLFSGIYKRGAGLGPAVTFLYSGPAINVLAIILTARVLGWELGLARALGAVAFSVVIGLLMNAIFIKDEKQRHEGEAFSVTQGEKTRPLWMSALHVASLTGILVFANWARPGASDSALWTAVYASRWVIAALFTAALILMSVKWFDRGELKGWMLSSRGFLFQIMPLLLLGVLAAGFLLGRPGQEGVIPSSFVHRLVGGNSFPANFFASVFGAFMYFATLTEIPILQGLIGAGMGKGPALALLLAGPALSLPNMIVIRSVIGSKKTAAYILLVVIMATISGMVFGTSGGS